LEVCRGRRNEWWETGPSRRARLWIQIGRANGRSHEGHEANPGQNPSGATHLPRLSPAPFSQRQSVSLLWRREDSDRSLRSQFNERAPRCKVRGTPLARRNETIGRKTFAQSSGRWASVTGPPERPNSHRLSLNSRGVRGPAQPTPDHDRYRLRRAWSAGRSKPPDCLLARAGSRSIALICPASP
jgi:hypothetical protein